MKKEYFLLIFAIIALLAYLFLHNRGHDNYLLPQIPEIDETKIESIELIKDKQTINCFKNNGEWVVTKEKFSGNTRLIKEMIASIKNLTITTLISEKENFKRYDLDKTKSIKVIAKGENKVLREFTIGKAASTQKHTFITLKDQKAIFHASGNLRRVFNKSIDNLRDKQIQDIDIEEIKSIEIIKGDFKRLITRKELSKTDAAAETEANTENSTKEKIQWQVKDNADLKQESATSLVETLSDLQCASFLEGLNKTDFGKKVPLLKIILKTEKTFGFTLFPKTEQDKYPGSSSQNKYLFLLHDYIADDIISEVNNLLNIKQEQ
jgi:hypothetical protein